MPETASNFQVLCINLSTFVSLFYFLKYLFIYFRLCSLFVAARGLSLVAVSGGYSSLWCVCGLLIAVASLAAEHGL